MNKNALVEAVAKQSGLDLTKAEAALGAVVAAIRAA